MAWADQELHFDAREMETQMKVLITGGAGFIGSQIVRDQLSEHTDGIVVLDKFAYSGFAEHLPEGAITWKDLSVFKGDLANPLDVEMVFKKYDGFDLVIHVAAESSVDKSIKVYQDFIQSNVMGTANLFKTCLDYKVPKVINFGTDEIYGDLSPEDPSFTETTRIKPRNIYSATKASQVHLADAFFHTFGLPVVTICPSNCYGPRQLPEKLLPRMIYLLEKNEPLPVYGTGQNVREWLYVEDISAAVSLLAKKGVPGEHYNVGSGSERTNLEILQSLSEMSGKPFNVRFIEDRKGHDFRYSIDYSKIHALGWEPQTTLGEGLRQTIEWYKDHWTWLEEQYQKIWK